jgi:hypothetical protein
MKPIKKIALVLLSLVATSTIATIVASMKITIPFFMVLLLFGFQIWDKIVETYVIKTALESLDAKPFKPYQIELNCSYCGKSSEVDVILTETTYKCPHCTRVNGIHVSFMTASIN